MLNRKHWLWLSVLVLTCGLFAPTILASTDHEFEDNVGLGCSLLKGFNNDHPS